MSSKCVYKCLVSFSTPIEWIKLQQIAADGTVAGSPLCDKFLFKNGWAFVDADDSILPDDLEAIDDGRELFDADQANHLDSIDLGWI
jgi:hypothetical protein